MAILFIASCTTFATEKVNVVAVIDTGFSFSKKTKGVKLCQYGHKDFTSQQLFEKRYTKTPVPKDTHNHGTNVTGLIQKFAGKSNYCMVIIKFYNQYADGTTNTLSSIKAIRYANRINAKYINYSAGGTMSDPAEKKEVIEFLNRGGRFIAAIGNENKNTKIVPFYPAMYDSRIVSVGAKDELGYRLSSSNYGSGVNRWEVGYKQEAFGITMTGTSQATAVTMGKIINRECAK